MFARKNDGLCSFWIRSIRWSIFCISSCRSTNFFNARSSPMNADLRLFSSRRSAANLAANPPAIARTPPAIVLNKSAITVLRSVPLPPFQIFERYVHVRASCSVTTRTFNFAMHLVGFGTLIRARRRGRLRDCALTGPATSSTIHALCQYLGTAALRLSGVYLFGRLVDSSLHRRIVSRVHLVHRRWDVIDM